MRKTIPKIMAFTAMAGLMTTFIACAPSKEVRSDKQAHSHVVGQNGNFQPTGWIAKTLPEIAQALASGEVTSEQLVKDYLARIAHVDYAGPTLQSILTLNPNILDEARALDKKRAAGQNLGALHGIPILLKDNIESKGAMATTAGALALKDNITRRDADLVEGLRAAGAIILGKTNLSQWANFRSNDSLSGWSALGGQVRNPHILDRNTCGSSAGSGAAMSASLAAGTVGTETNGSIICPSTINGVVGFKPTVGLVSQKLIIPISFTQDTAGPITKTVKGAAMMLGAMTNGGGVDYVVGLDARSLEGTRIGVLRFAQGSHPHIHKKFNEALRALETAGAKLVEIESFDLNVENYGHKSLSVLEYEFKATLNAYLANAAPEVKTRSLSEIIAFNEKHADVELALFDQGLLEASDALGDLDTPAYKEALKEILSATRENGMDALLTQNNVSVLVAPSGPLAGQSDPINGDVWPSWAGAGYLAAVAGYPHLTVPMGDVYGLPIGLSFMGGKNKDAQILSYGYAYEHATRLRVEPKYLRTSEERKELKKAMLRK